MTLYLTIAFFAGAFVGLIVTALLVAARNGALAENELEAIIDSTRLTTLEDNKHCLVFNHRFNTWGVMDGQNNMLSSGSTARAALDALSAGDAP